MGLRKIARSLLKRKTAREEDLSPLEHLPSEILERCLELSLWDLRDSPEARVRRRTALATVSRTFRQTAHAVDRDVLTLILTRTCQHVKLATSCNARPRRLELVCTIIDRKTWHGRRTLEIGPGMLFQDFVQTLLPDLPSVSSVHLSIHGHSGKLNDLGPMEAWAANQTVRCLSLMVSSKPNITAQYGHIIKKLSRLKMVEDLTVICDSLTPNWSILHAWLQDLPLLKTMHFSASTPLPFEPTIKACDDLPFLLEHLHLDGPCHKWAPQMLLPAKRLYVRQLDLGRPSSASTPTMPHLRELNCGRIEVFDIAALPSLFSSITDLRVFRLGRISAGIRLEALIRLIPPDTRVEMLEMGEMLGHACEKLCHDRGLELHWIRPRLLDHVVRLPESCCTCSSSEAGQKDEESGQLIGESDVRIWYRSLSLLASW